MMIARNASLLAAALGMVAVAGCTNTDHRTAAAGPAPVAQYNPTPRELAPGMVEQVQASLHQQGLYQGAVDGVWGPATQTGVRSYQQAHGLSPTGKLDSPTLAAMNLPSDGAMPSSGSSTDHRQPAAPPPADHNQAAPAPSDSGSQPANPPADANSQQTPSDQSNSTSGQ